MVERALELLLNFPSGPSQWFLGVVGCGCVVAKLGDFAIDGWLDEDDEKGRRREQYIREAVEARAAASRLQGGTRQQPSGGA